MEGSSLKPHGFLVYLPPELCIAIVRLQADMQLGRSFPVLYAINEGLYKLGYTTKVTYQLFEKRYSQKLIKEEPIQPSEKEAEEQKQLKTKEKTFGMVLQQWNEHSDPIWREKWITEAKKYCQKSENARLVLALEERQRASS